MTLPRHRPEEVPTTSPTGGSVVVVGASRGLGRGLVDEHRRRGWEVVGTVRSDPPSGQDGLRWESLDVTDPRGPDALRDRLPPRIDRLFVVAGRGGPVGPIADADPDGFAATVLTNVLGVLRVVDRLADLVAETGTVAVMSSTQGSIGLNDVVPGATADNETYRISKAGLNVGFASVAHRHADARTWLAVSPGYVRTDMTGPEAPLSVAESVARVADVLDARAGRGGLAFVDVTGEDLPW